MTPKLTNVTNMQNDAAGSEFQRIKSLVQQKLNSKDYASAEAAVIREVMRVGSSYANRLYPLLWEHAMAKGNTDLRAYFLSEQARWDPENIAGEFLRRQMMSMAAESAPQKNIRLSEAMLCRLAVSPALKEGWTHWDENIRLLHQYLANGPLDSCKLDSDQSRYADSLPMIFSAGSGRSGSSAVFDWVNCFSDVRGTRVQYFYLRDFVRTLSAKLSSDDYCVNLVTLLWNTFLGRFVYTSKAAHRKAALARTVITTFGTKNVARTCNDLIRILASPNLNAAQPLAHLPLLLGHVCRMIGSPTHRFAASGWLDFDQAEIYPHITNAFFVCSTRDPRDVYAEHVLLTRTFDHKVSKFVKEYRSRMESLEKVVSTKPRNVIVIRFEDFVRSPSARRNLAARLGLDESKGWQCRGQYPFEPDISAKNIGVFRNSKDNSSIKTIEELLPEYCTL